jgi:hypothetical protein
MISLGVKTTLAGRYERDMTGDLGLQYLPDSQIQFSLRWRFRFKRIVGQMLPTDGSAECSGAVRFSRCPDAVLSCRDCSTVHPDKDTITLINRFLAGRLFML